MAHITWPISSKLQPPQRGDVVVFHAPKSVCFQDFGCDYIKRVIGVPGDKIRIYTGQVYLNGQVLDETAYILEPQSTNPGNFLKHDQEVIVPENQYFVLGDNRQYSSDSRVWGFIPREDIFAKMWFCYSGCK